MNGRLIRVFLLMSLAAAAACRGDRTPEEAQGSAGFVLPGEEPYVSPEDSAKAAEEIRAHTEALRDSLRRASGDRGEDGPPPAPAGGDSPEARYRACVAQASQADSAVRGRLQAACENIRNHPAPAP